MENLFPPTIIRILGCFAPFFAANNFFYFRGFVLAAMLPGQTRKCVTKIARVCFFVDRHIASWERFLSQSQWEPIGLQEHMVSLVQEHFGEQLFIDGALLAWVDTTLIAKVMGKMRGVQKWHDHSGNPDRGTSLVGHHWALAGLICSSVVAGTVTVLCWPFPARLIAGQANPLGFVVNAQGVAQAMNFWDAVCPLMAQLQTLGGGLPMRVVADAYFAKAPFITRMLA